MNILHDADRTESDADDAHVNLRGDADDADQMPMSASDKTATVWGLEVNDSVDAYI